MVSQNTPWYAAEAGLFGPAYLSQYGHLLTPERTSAEVDFVERALELEPGARILDLPCGHGRHAIELARRGYRVTGQDLNRFFLGKAREAADQAGLAIEWVEGDMRDVRFEKTFDAVVNLFTSFGFFDRDEDDLRVLRGMAKALRSDGVVLLDVMNRDWIMRNFESRTWHELPGDGHLLIERDYDVASSRIRERRIAIDAKGQRKQFEFVVRHYTLAELTTMCESAGLAVVATYGGIDEQPYSLDSPRCVVTARKPTAP